jgi:hypothetical protein
VTNSSRTLDQISHPLFARVEIPALFRAVVDLAGDAAQREFAPRSRYAAHSDLHNLASLLEYISGSNEMFNARLRVVSLQAQRL